MSSIYDVIISGGGPSGSLLGYYLSGSGIKTLIIEKATFPRLKVCAGGIQHRILDLIPFDISQVIEKTITGIYFSYKNRDVFFKRYNSPIIHTVDRRKFDDFFADKAIKSGCEINFGEETRDYEYNNRSIRITTDKARYDARILVGADGARGMVHNRLLNGTRADSILGYMIEIPYKLNGNRNNVKGNIPDDRFTIKDRDNHIFKLHDAIRLDFNGTKKGYCWVFPKKDFFSAGIGAPARYARTIREYFRFFLDSFFAFDGSCDRQARLLAHEIPLRNNDLPIKDYRVISVGDAACLADCFTGEGLYNSFKSSVIAFDSIRAALDRSSFDFDDYSEKIGKNIYTDIRYSVYFARIFYSSSLFFYKLIKKNDNYFNACCRLLRGERTYHDVFRRLKSLDVAK